MNNNEAFVCKIGIVNPIEGADKIMSATLELKEVPFTTVVVGKETLPGTEVVYFDSNLCISDSIIEALDKKSPNYAQKDFVSMGNYLAKGNRVRCIKLRGAISNGLIVELEKFKSIFKKDLNLKEGDSFTELDGQAVCHKYVPPVKAHSPGMGKGQHKGKIQSRMLEDQFKFHIDTEQLLRNFHKLNHSDIISISSKWHGCVAEDTEIDTLEYGIKTIKEIVDNKISCHIKAYDIFSNNDVYAKIDDFYLKRNHGDWYEIELEDGKKIKITGNNPVWLPDLNCYRRVDELEGSEYLLVSNS